MLLIKQILNLKSVILILVVAALMFAFNYYIMLNLPGYRDFACVIGAGLTPLNIVFSLFLSLLTGIFVAAFIVFNRSLNKTRLASSSTSALGLFLGNFTIFCPLCVFPAISLFGLSISLSFFTTYDLWIKGVSIVLMLLGLYILNRKLNCNSCKISN